jgi:hypothetical protein
MMFAFFTGWRVRNPMTFPGDNLVLPIVPSAVSVEGGMRVDTRTLVNTRSVSVGQGALMRSLSFTSVFPYSPQSHDAVIPWIRDLVYSPPVYVSYLRAMMSDNKVARLAFAYTDGASASTFWSLPVTIRSFTTSEVGGSPDMLGYSLQVSEHYELQRPDIDTNKLWNYGQFLETNTESKNIGYVDSVLDGRLPPPPEPDPEPASEPAPSPTPERDPPSNEPAVGDPAKWPVLEGKGWWFGSYAKRFPTVRSALAYYYPNVVRNNLADFNEKLPQILEYNFVDEKGIAAGAIMRRKRGKTRAPKIYVPSHIHSKWNTVGALADVNPRG